MPEATFTVRWPDGLLEECYSPSLVIHDHLEAGASYPVAEFVRRSSAALAEASDRVRARYGVACTSAAASRERIAGRAAAYLPGDRVAVLTVEPPLPPTSSAPPVAP